MNSVSLLIISFRSHVYGVDGPPLEGWIDLYSDTASVKIFDDQIMSLFELPQVLSNMIVSETDPVFGDKRRIPWKMDSRMSWKPSQAPRKAPDPVMVSPVWLRKQPNRKKTPRKQKPEKVQKLVPKDEKSPMCEPLAEQSPEVRGHQPGRAQRQNGSAESCQTSVSQPKPEKQTVVSDSVDQDEGISMGTPDQDGIPSMDHDVLSSLKDTPPPVSGGELFEVNPHCPYASEIARIRPGKQGPVVIKWKDRPGVCSPHEKRRNAGCRIIKRLLKQRHVMLGERLWWKQGNIRALAVGWVALDGILCGRCGWVVNVAEFAKCAGVEVDSPASFIQASTGVSLGELGVDVDVLNKKICL